MRYQIDDDVFSATHVVIYCACDGSRAEAVGKFVKQEFPDENISERSENGLHVLSFEPFDDFSAEDARMFARRLVACCRTQDACILVHATDEDALSRDVNERGFVVSKSGVEEVNPFMGKKEGKIRGFFNGGELVDFEISAALDDGDFEASGTSVPSGAFLALCESADVPSVFKASENRGHEEDAPVVYGECDGAGHVVAATHRQMIAGAFVRKVLEADPDAGICLADDGHLCMGRAGTDDRPAA